MSATMEYATKTQLYQRVKKPLLERQRRARINKCLDGLKTIIAEFQDNDAILHMDKAEMLETTITYMRNQLAARKTNNNTTKTSAPPSMDSYRNGYMNAVNEVSRVMASTPGMSVELGRSVMTHLGRVYNRLQKVEHQQQQQSQPQMQHNVSMESPLTIDCHSAPLSPASSGYHSDYESPAASPVVTDDKVWRPW